LLGSARWAEKKEVKSAGLLNRDGIVLGRLGHDYRRHNDPEHLLWGELDAIR
jgi:type IV secretion system protein VirD4